MFLRNVQMWLGKNPLNTPFSAHSPGKFSHAAQVIKDVDYETKARGAIVAHQSNLGNVM